MALVCVALIAVAVGALRGGSLRYYPSRPLRWLWMLGAALLLAAVWTSAEWLGFRPMRLPRFAPLLGWTLAALFIMGNLSRRGMKLVALGTLLQLVGRLEGGGPLVGMGAGSWLDTLCSACAHGAHRLTEGLSKPLRGGLDWLGKFFQEFLGGLGEFLQRLMNALGDAVIWLFQPQGLALAGYAVLCAGVFLLVQDIICAPKENGERQSFRVKV